MSRTPGRAAPARASFLLLILVAALALHPSQNALAAQADPAGRKASVRELTRMGFFQDFDELDLEELLTPTDATVTVARVIRCPSSAPPARYPS